MLRASKQNIFLYITEYVGNSPDKNKRDSTMTRVQSIEFLSNITVFVCLLNTIFTNLLTNQNNKLSLENYCYTVFVGQANLLCRFKSNQK